MTDDPWDKHADWWVANFTDGVDPEYTEQIIPMAVSELRNARRIIDVGCGEGQVARALAAQGAHVLGVDPVARHVDLARERGGGPEYQLGVATQLPANDGEFDAAIACLVFEHIDDLDGAVREISRVLAPGGLFAFFLNHPLLQTPGSGWIDDHMVDPPEQYWRIGPYLVSTSTDEEVEKGVFVRFVHRPLSAYVNCLADNGLVLERMIEPSPPDGFIARAPEYELAHTVPRLLYLRLRKSD